MGGSGPFQDKPSLRVEGLSLARGGRVLFDDLSFGASPGSYVELRGANGAGKTSLLRALGGFLKPRTGTITFENVAEPTLAIHFVGHVNALKPTTSVREHVRYWSGLFGAPHDERLVLSSIGLEGLGDRPVRTLSQGQARRLALSRLFINVRPIWLLDEPAAGLDDAGRELVDGLIQAQQANGDIVIAAVHEALGPKPTQTLHLGAA
jgi:heme exporter protein A